MVYCSSMRLPVGSCFFLGMFRMSTPASYLACSTGHPISEGTERQEVAC